MDRPLEPLQHQQHWYLDKTYLLCRLRRGHHHCTNLAVTITCASATTTITTTTANTTGILATTHMASTTTSHFRFFCPYGMPNSNAAKE
jgi:hypothetical protein